LVGTAFEALDGNEKPDTEQEKGRPPDQIYVKP
jgi:hypothetical protein